MNDAIYYDLEAKQEPTTSVHVVFRERDEIEKFLGILRDFAKAHQIPESRLRATSNYSTPQFKTGPIYQSDTVVITSMCCLAPEDPYGDGRMSLLRRDFAPAEFKKLADDYLARFQQAFSNRVQSTFEDNRK